MLVVCSDYLHLKESKEKYFRLYQYEADVNKRLLLEKSKVDKRLHNLRKRHQEVCRQRDHYVADLDAYKHMHSELQDNFLRIPYWIRRIFI